MGFYNSFPVKAKTSLKCPSVRLKIEEAQNISKKGIYSLWRNIIMCPDIELHTMFCTLERFTVKCEGAGRRISTSKSETMVLRQKRVQYLSGSGSSGGVEVPRGLVHEWGKSGAGDLQVDQCRVWSNVDFVPVCCGEESWAERQNSVFTGQSLFTCGHELWLVAERMRIWIPAAEMRYLCRLDWTLS